MRVAILIGCLLSSAMGHAEPLKPGEAWIANADGGVVTIFLSDAQHCQFDARSPQDQWLSAECVYSITGDKLTLEFPRPLPGNGPKQLNLVYSEALDTLTLSSTKTFRRTSREAAMAELKK